MQQYDPCAKRAFEACLFACPICMFCSSGAPAGKALCTSSYENLDPEHSFALLHLLLALQHVKGSKVLLCTRRHLVAKPYLISSPRQGSPFASLAMLLFLFLRQSGCCPSCCRCQPAPSVQITSQAWGGARGFGQASKF